MAAIMFHRETISEGFGSRTSRPSSRARTSSAAWSRAFMNGKIPTGRA
jgi:hypothetical protein